ASSITSAMSSAFVVSRLMRRVYAAASGELLLPQVPEGALDLQLGLRTERLRVVDEPARRASISPDVVDRVAGREDRAVCLVKRLVLRERQGHPLRAVPRTAFAEERPGLVLLGLGEVEALDGHPHLAVHVRPRVRAPGTLVRQHALPVEGSLEAYALPADG